MARNGFTTGKRNYRDIDELLMDVSSHGLRRVKDMATDWAIRNTISKVKTKFGMDMEFSYPALCDIATKWVKKHDKHFRDHIVNPYNYEDVGYTPILAGEFFLVLDSHTLAYVSANYEHRTSQNNVEDQRRIYIYIFGKHMLKFFNELRKEVVNARNDSFMLYTISGQHDQNGKNWFTCIGEPMKQRPMDTLFFEPGVKEKVINHLDSWRANAEIYQSRGLTFKTGILVYGVAGTGKSSLATAIATYLKCSVVIIDTASFAFIDTNEVTKSINSDDDMYVVLLDEIDAIFKSRDDSDITESEKRGVIKLLSFLDSPMSPNNVVFVATTNYYDRLDPAVKRKGRFDLEIELGNISYETGIEMCHGFNLSEAKTKMVMNHHKPDELINPASLQAQILSALSNKEVTDHVETTEADNSSDVEYEEDNDDNELPTEHNEDCDDSGESFNRASILETVTKMNSVCNVDDTEFLESISTTYSPDEEMDVECDDSIDNEPTPSLRRTVASSADDGIVCINVSNDDVEEPAFINEEIDDIREESADTSTVSHAGTFKGSVMVAEMPDPNSYFLKDSLTDRLDEIHDRIDEVADTISSQNRKLETLKKIRKASTWKNSSRK